MSFDAKERLLEIAHIIPGRMAGACIKAAEEITRLYELCDKWNTECDEMREDNRRLAKELELAKAEIEQMAAQVEVAREAFKTICDDPCNEWEVANKALAAISDPSAILAERDARAWEKAADFLDGYHYLSANFAAAQEDMRKEAARIREGVK